MGGTIILDMNDNILWYRP